jgi:hypothetical protein
MLLRLRRLRLDDSRREMARRLRAEDAAARELCAASGTMERELAALQDAHQDVLVSGTLVWWSGRCREMVEQAEQAHQRAVADIPPQRAYVTAAKAAAEAIEMMAERALDAAMREGERRDEAEIDDAAQRSAIRKR